MVMDITHLSVAWNKVQVVILLEKLILWTNIATVLCLHSRTSIHTAEITQRTASSDYATSWMTFALIPVRTTDFLCKMSRPAPMPWQSLIQWVFGALAPGVKWLGLEADHSPPPNTKIKNAWSYTSTNATCLNGAHRDMFTFTLQPTNITATGMKPCALHQLQQKGTGMWDVGWVVDRELNVLCKPQTLSPSDKAPLSLLP
jgi:hypothetical protein